MYVDVKRISILVATKKIMKNNVRGWITGKINWSKIKMGSSSPDKRKVVVTKKNNWWIRNKKKSIKFIVIFFLKK